MKRHGRSRRFWVMAFLVTALGIYLGLRVETPPAAETSSPEPVSRPVAKVVRPNVETPRAPVMEAEEAGGERPVTSLTGPGVLPEPVYHPRPAGEWQGMQVNLSLRAQCDRSSRCGLGMACIDGRCGPCTADSQCSQGEACVLDHCVPREQVSCRRKADCGGEALCVLTGYSTDARGNGEMRAECQEAEGGLEQDVAQLEAPESVEAGPATVQAASMLESLLTSAPEEPEGKAP